MKVSERTAVEQSFDDGVVHGMAMAAALLVRTFGQDTLALEVLGAAGLDSKKTIHKLHLEDYDAEPLLRIVRK